VHHARVRLLPARGRVAAVAASARRLRPVERARRVAAASCEHTEIETSLDARDVVELAPALAPHGMTAGAHGAARALATSGLAHASVATAGFVE
jgi:hypothetical protein